MSLATTREPAAPVQPASKLEEPLYEVVNGQRVEPPPMSFYATLISSQLHAFLHTFVRTHRLGTVVMEALLILDAENDERRRPDVAFISARRWPLSRLFPKTGDLEVTPDLAVEVVSPNDLFEDVLARMREYFRLGVRQVWLIAPRQGQIYVYDSPTQIRVWESPEELDGGTLFPGLRLPLRTLFSRQAETNGAAQTP